MPDDKPFMPKASYTQAEFYRLIEEVESQGGEHVDAAHDIVVHDALDLSGQPPAAQNCGEPALFDVPYEPMGYDGTLATIRMCAVDDRMGLMPRFMPPNAPGSPR